MAATSLATAVTCFCLSIEMSTVMLGCLFEISRLYSGFFASMTQLEEIPDWKFADALSYIKYSLVGVTLNEMEGLELQCKPGLGPCKYTTGEQIIIEKGFDEFTVGSCAGYLIVLIVGFRILAYLGLRFIKH
jgi:ATP-binding cassette subfamily G (WHITE) protein 2